MLSFNEDGKEPTVSNGVTGDSDVIDRIDGLVNRVGDRSTAGVNDQSFRGRPRFRGASGLTSLLGVELGDTSWVDRNEDELDS